MPPPSISRMWIRLILPQAYDSFCLHASSWQRDTMRWRVPFRRKADKTMASEHQQKGGTATATTAAPNKRARRRQPIMNVRSGCASSNLPKLWLRSFFNDDLFSERVYTCLGFEFCPNPWETRPIFCPSGACWDCVLHCVAVNAHTHTPK